MGEPRVSDMRAELARHGMTLRKEPYAEEFRVNFRGGGEATAYYTNDRADAVSSGIDMRRRLDAAAGR